MWTIATFLPMLHEAHNQKISDFSYVVCIFSLCLGIGVDDVDDETILGRCVHDGMPIITLLEISVLFSLLVNM